MEHLPEGLTRDEFCRVYDRQLDRHRREFVQQLRALLARTVFTSPVDELDLGVFPDASGDGDVSVWCYFRGRNTRVSSTEPSLFAGKAIPLFNTATREVVVAWVRSCWAEAGGDAYAIPATVTGHDDCCGSSEVHLLNGSAKLREGAGDRGRRRR